jgi:hypothetical protein
VQHYLKKPEAIFVWKSPRVTIKARAKMMRPVFFPILFLSRSAENRDKSSISEAMARNQPLCRGIHWPMVALPSPKLARIRGTCQQKANKVAERIAPMLLNILFMNSPTLSSEGLQLFNPLHLVHHPANIGQASPSLGVGGLAAAFSLFLFGHDPLHDGGAAVFGKILSYVLFCVAETVTDHVLDHFHFLQECWRAIKNQDQGGRLGHLSGNHDLSRFF